MTYPKVNRLFTFASFSTAPALGSVVSFLWHGGAIWCVFEVATGRRRFSPDRTMRLIYGIMLVYVATNLMAFLANNPSWEMARKLLPLVTFLMFPFSYSIWTISNREEIARAAILGSAVAAASGFAVTLVQYYIVAMRPEGGAGNALVFADVACLAGLVCLAGALTLETARARLLLFAYALAFLAVLYSGSRSVWGVMLGASILVVLLCRGRVKNILRGRMLAILAVVVTVAVLASGVVATRMELLGEEVRELAVSGNYNTSSGLRVALYEIGSRLVMERPFLGHGLQNTTHLIGHHLNADYGVNRSFSHFHNGFLTAFVEGGILCGLAVLALFAAIAVAAWRALQNAVDPIQRFGGLLLAILFCIYAGGGSVNLIFGHDILDSMFMVVLITGLYLATGSPQLPVEEKEETETDQARP